MLKEIWSYRYLGRIDFRILPIIAMFIMISLAVMSSMDAHMSVEHDGFFSPLVKSQLRGFGVGILGFIFFAGFDYNKLREWTWILYVIMIIVLIGVFFTGSIQSVHRWYRIPIINVAFQPSEYSKLSVVIALSWFLERRSSRAREWNTALLAGVIVGIPFLLILKQPDLGTALVLLPIVLVMFYFGDIHPFVTRCMAAVMITGVAIVSMFFLEIISHEEFRPYATKVIKEYQYERLNPETHHQWASVTAIAVGGMTGEGWKKSEFTGGGWLPAAHTDSVFSAFGEEFGFLGLLLLLVLFYSLIYFSFRVSAVAKDPFGRLLAVGVSVYLAIHIIINIGMMTGFLPITGVPLLLVTYGGSSILSTMIALGILQSIYSRRFMF